MEKKSDRELLLVNGIPHRHSGAVQEETRIACPSFPFVWKKVLAYTIFFSLSGQNVKEKVCDTSYAQEETWFTGNLRSRRLRQYLRDLPTAGNKSDQDAHQSINSLPRTS